MKSMESVCVNQKSSLSPFQECVHGVLKINEPLNSIKELDIIPVSFLDANVEEEVAIIFDFSVFEKKERVITVQMRGEDEFRLLHGVEGMQEIFDDFTELEEGLDSIFSAIMSDIHQLLEILEQEDDQILDDVHNSAEESDGEESDGEIEIEVEEGEYGKLAEDVFLVRDQESFEYSSMHQEVFKAVQEVVKVRTMRNNPMLTPGKAKLTNFDFPGDCLSVISDFLSDICDFNSLLRTCRSFYDTITCKKGNKHLTFRNLQFSSRWLHKLDPVQHTVNRKKFLEEFPVCYYVQKMLFVVETKDDFVFIQRCFNLENTPFPNLVDVTLSLWGKMRAFDSSTAPASLVFSNFVRTIPRFIRSLCVVRMPMPVKCLSRVNLRSLKLVQLQDEFFEELDDLRFPIERRMPTEHERFVERYDKIEPLIYLRLKENGINGIPRYLGPAPANVLKLLEGIHDGETQKQVLKLTKDSVIRAIVLPKVGEVEFKKLRHLSLEHFKEINAACLATLLSSKTVVSLHLRGVERINSDGGGGMEMSQLLSNVKTLKLSGIYFHDSQIPPEFFGHFVHLEKLTISKCRGPIEEKRKRSWFYRAPKRLKYLELEEVEAKRCSSSSSETIHHHYTDLDLRCFDHIRHLRLVHCFSIDGSCFDSVTISKLCFEYYGENFHFEYFPEKLLKSLRHLEMNVLTRSCSTSFSINRPFRRGVFNPPLLVFGIGDGKPLSKQPIPPSYFLKQCVNLRVLRLCGDFPSISDESLSELCVNMEELDVSKAQMKRVTHLGVCFLSNMYHVLNKTGGEMHLLVNGEYTQIVNEKLFDFLQSNRDKWRLSVCCLKELSAAGNPPATSINTYRVRCGECARWYYCKKHHICPPKPELKKSH